MLGLLGDEWNLLITQQSLMGASRYNHFMTRLPISNSVLSRRLRTLTDEGLLSRSDGQYLPTARSRSLWPLLVSVWEWERTWVAAHREHLPAMRHHSCGQLFSPLTRCSACGAEAGDADVEITLGPSGQWSRSTPVASTRRRSDSDVTTREAGLFPETMAVLGNRWAAAILVAAFLQTSRFTDFQNQLGVPPSLLAERLQRFCAIGVVTTTEEMTYLLTDKGRAFGGVLVAALGWAQRWFIAPEGPAVVLRHRNCGQTFTAELACDRCGERLTGAQVEVTHPAEVGIP
ncbi:MAG: winged helix-turn-helix transcriptional regulator [Mycobacterium sp.]